MIARLVAVAAGAASISLQGIKNFRPLRGAASTLPVYRCAALDGASAGLRKGHSRAATDCAATAATIAATATAAVLTRVETASAGWIDIHGWLPCDGNSWCLSWVLD